jgi:hypothetical protein
MRLLSFERRWLRAICEAMLPSGVRQDLPGAADVPVERFFDEFTTTVPFDAAIGVRAFTWLLTFAPVFWKLRTFGSLRPADQVRMLEAMEGSRFYVVREIPGLIKLVACLAWASQPPVQRALGVPRPDDRPPPWAVPQ